MSFDPAIFGKGFHAFVQQEFELFGSLSPVFHILSLVSLLLIFITGNKFRKAVSVYFTINWIFLLGYWGIYGCIYWYGYGIIYLAVYAFAPILLLLISINWILELKTPAIDFEVKTAPKPRFLVLLILAWGFWYPSYIYGQGFSFQLKDLLFSYYGLMPCPTTMFVLSLMTMKYPAGNKRLYRLMAVYALFIGTATVASGWLPDIPFILLGIYALILEIAEARSGLRKAG